MIEVCLFLSVFSNAFTIVQGFDILVKDQFILCGSWMIQLVCILKILGTLS